MTKRFVESPEAKLYFWSRYRRLIPVALALLILAVGFVIGCQSDSRAVSPSDQAVQAVAMPNAGGTSSLAAFVGHEFQHIHVPLVRIVIVEAGDNAVVCNIRVNGSSQIKATIGSDVFTSALVDYVDITGDLVDQTDPAVF